MLKFFKTSFLLLKKSFIRWNRNDPFPKGATIAYYTLFSLPSLLIIVMTIASSFFEREAVQGRITAQIGDFIGRDSAKAVENMIVNVSSSDDSAFAIIISIGMVLFAATGVFFHLKKTMNDIWNVAAKKANFGKMLLDRLISFGMVLVIGLLLLISLVISALLRFVKENIEQFSESFTTTLVDMLNFGISFVIITILFAALFKLLPDIRVRWQTTFVGAALTTVLFLVGEFLISFYFGKSEPASVYGAAGSVVIILIWVNYICLILFFGAEFTVQYAAYKNERVRPNKFAEPAIYQEIKKLSTRHISPKEEKRILERLRDNLEITEE
ncbi:YihY/virulence factor BrkB family protein [Sinomicrobium pectinilyticum]|uniref:YihY/virulence factor BrkB family protein n=1 Tax=Sinomicrobium pectinilyticum TaxID=1084421 RepID=A0A3N0EMP9_SINP1|nr:YihY/virulence factor BrkB family protein [Sinomicrobium pectinilyticum]RNL89007.1 YihY/virulence factor BrkB family protein [Sinomicrobium pectinilyticum]